MRIKNLSRNILIMVLFITGTMLPFFIALNKYHILPNITKRFFIKSTCPSSNFRGTSQKVVSYSFYGPTNSSYFKGIPQNAELVSKMYPGWSMRLYHNINPSDHDSQSQLKRIVSKYPHLDECHVEDIPQDDFPNIENKFGMVWRFVVMGDESVDIFLIRDLDSVFIQREIDAVNEWLNSNFNFHIMRDHAGHKTHILGGMWEGKNKDMRKMYNLTRELVNASNSHEKSSDQTLLSDYVWPVAKEDSMAHDSFFCKTYPNTKPWPIQRVDMTFVGANPEFQYIDRECPVECRPPTHKDWKYC